MPSSQRPSLIRLAVLGVAAVVLVTSYEHIPVVNSLATCRAPSWRECLTQDALSEPETPPDNGDGSGDTAGQQWRDIPIVATRPDVANYDRDEFGPSWTDNVNLPQGHNDCDTRNDILRRDLGELTLGDTDDCPDKAVLSGSLHDRYTDEQLTHTKGDRAVEIDHIIPLKAAWDLGAHSWSEQKRVLLANDPGNLIAVGADVNGDKSDSLPGEWMPPNEQYHCNYATRIVSVTQTYGLALDTDSKNTLAAVLEQCE